MKPHGALLPIILPQGIQGGAPIRNLLLVMLLQGLHSSLECLCMLDRGGVLQVRLLAIIYTAKEAPTLLATALTTLRAKQP